MENDYKITIIKQGTRKEVTAKVTEICETLPGSPKREQLGIFASPRATMYFRGSWLGVDIRDIPELSKKGAVVLFVEKRGVVDQIKHIADRYGIAIVNTQGHLSEYAKDLIPKIIEKDGYVAILTDFDCAGISIAEKVIKEIIDEEILSEEIVDSKIKRLGIVPEDLDYFLENLSNPKIKKREQLQKMVEEPYPRQSKEDRQQQPGTNVVNPIIEFAVDYYIYNQKPGWGLVQKDKRYEYIYNNFQYLTGLKLDEIITNDYFKSMYEEDGMVKRIINRAIVARSKGSQTYRA